MLAAYGSSGSGGSAGYWLLVLVIVLVILGFVWWAIRRTRAIGRGTSTPSSRGWSDASGLTGGSDETGPRTPSTAPTGPPYP
jgi:hypothetical protein